MLPFSNIPDPVLFGSSGYPLRIEAGLGPQLNTSVNGRSTIFTGNKTGCRWISRVHGRFRGNVGTTNQRMISRFRGNVAARARANISDTTG
jgi:hypothetical protein